MSQVAIINGRVVCSDKEVASIVNTRISFSDGSWCDVATGQVMNKGRGYINIDSPEEAGDQKITKGPDVYSGNNLEVCDIVADLDVQVHEGVMVEVTIVGPENEVKGIDVATHGSTVLITGKGRTGSSQGITIISGNGKSVTRIGRMTGSSVVLGGGTFIGGIIGNVVTTGAGESQTKITVKVPKGASVKLSDIIGECSIGDIEGDLLANAGSSTIQAGRVGNATLNVKGHSDILISHVNGFLTANIMGSGKVCVDSGKVNMLTFQVMGSGDAIFNGEADNAILSVMGSGDIKVAKVINRPSKNIMGSGDIRIGNW